MFFKMQICIRCINIILFHFHLAFLYSILTSYMNFVYAYTFLFDNVYHNCYNTSCVKGGTFRV